MTTPYYSADLYPGMIADYKILDKDDINIRMLEWLNENMQGPFVIKGSSTAHWYTHIQISNEDDAKRLDEEFKVEICTENIRGSGTYVQQRLPHGVAMDRCKREPIYYGDKCINLATWIEQNALPVTYIFTAINEQRLSSDKQNTMREVSYLWTHIIESDLRLTIPFDGERNKAIEWCEKNCEGNFKSIIIPLYARFRSIIKKKDLPKTVFFFEQARDATLFKTFCG